MHAVVQENLESFLDGSLQPLLRMEVEGHLRQCDSCRKHLEEAKLTNEWMKALVTELMMPAPGFYARVRARVEAEGGQVWPFWQLMPAFSRQLGYAVAVTLLLASGYFVSDQLTEHQSAQIALALDAPAIHSEAPDLASDDVHLKRERVMVALMAPVSATEGD